MAEVKVGDVYENLTVKDGTQTVRELKDQSALCVDHQGSSHWVTKADLQDAKKFKIKQPKSEVKS